MFYNNGPKHVIEAQQFSRQGLENFFEETKRMEEDFNSGLCRDTLYGKIMYLLFYEPSTRTRISFQTAHIQLGGRTIHTENAKEFSSAVKGETITDTIRVLSQYRPDVIVMRHYEEGAAAKAANVSKVPIINAGDGKGQHPTQALLDIYTIKKRFKCIDGLSIAMVGDLSQGRTVRSLSYLLGKFRGIRIFFVSPSCSRMRDDIKDYLKRHDVEFLESNDLCKVAPSVNVIYQTRVQKERGGGFDLKDSALGHFIVDNQILSLLPENAIIMHPLPRNEEIATEVDNDPRAVYLTDQVFSGLITRMTLLRSVLS